MAQGGRQINKPGTCSSFKTLPGSWIDELPWCRSPSSAWDLPATK